MWLLKNENINNNRKRSGKHPNTWNKTQDFQITHESKIKSKRKLEKYLDWIKLKCCNQPPKNKRILEWGTISFSRASSRPRGRTRVSCIAGRFFTIWATRETHFFTFLSLTSLIRTILLLTLQFQPNFMANIDTRTDWPFVAP